MKFLALTAFMSILAVPAFAEVTFTDIRNALLTRPSVSIGITEKFTHVPGSRLVRDKENMWIGARVSMPMSRHFALEVDAERIAATEPVYSGKAGIWVKF